MIKHSRIFAAPSALVFLLATAVALALAGGLSMCARASDTARLPRIAAAGSSGDSGQANGAAANAGQRQPATISAAEAARRARRQYGGRVLNVVLEDASSGPYYRVKLLDAGRMRVVHIEARR